MKPQEDFNEKKDEKEEELLQKKIKELKPDDIQRLFEQGIYCRLIDLFYIIFFLDLFSIYSCLDCPIGRAVVLEAA